MTTLLDRALDAEERLESAQARIADLESRLRGVLGAEPESAVRALAWMSRAENAEKLLIELARYLDENPSLIELLPTGYDTRLRTQLRTVEIQRRDQETMGEKPAEDEWWSGYQVGEHRLQRVDRRRPNPSS